MGIAGCDRMCQEDLATMLTTIWENLVKLDYKASTSTVKKFRIRYRSLEFWCRTLWALSKFFQEKKKKERKK